jgi:predicted NAD/FAD-dependent oxidoreductase
MVIQPSRAPRRIAIIGAGMAGLACAEHLVRAGLSVRLFDKGRGVGGRMSTRRLQTPRGEVCFDHGAAMFTAKDPAFRLCVDAWIKAGHVAEWPEGGAGALVGAPTMNAPLRFLARDLDVAWSAQVTGLSRRDQGWRLDIAGQEPGAEGPFDAVVLAIPPEQATPLLSPHSFDLAVYAAMARSRPVWSVMVAFEAPAPASPGRLNGCEVLAEAIRETSKPGRSGIEAWTLQATSDWTQEHLEAGAAEVGARLLEALSRRFPAPLPAVLALQAHRWRYARPARATSGPIWRDSVGLGLCGDWVAGDGVEAAWRSGVRLADRITGRVRSTFEQEAEVRVSS